MNNRKDRTIQINFGAQKMVDSQFKSAGSTENKPDRFLFTSTGEVISPRLFGEDLRIVDLAGQAKITFEKKRE